MCGINLLSLSLVINKDNCNIDFNIIPDNEALVIDIDLCNNQNLILATIYCPNENPNFRLFQTINNFSDNVMFVGNFSSKLEAYGCAKKKLGSNAQKYSKCAVDKAILTSESVRSESRPFLDETLMLIKEKRRFRRQCSQAHDPLVKTRIKVDRESCYCTFLLDAHKII